MEIAKLESNKSSKDQKLGCVIAKRGRFISKGFNSNKTHPRFGSGYFMRLHSEGAAIWDAFKAGRLNNIEGATAYIYRKNGLLAAPCSGCQGLLKQYGVKTVIYTKGN